MKRSLVIAVMVVFTDGAWAQAQDASVSDAAVQDAGALDGGPFDGSPVVDAGAEDASSLPDRRIPCGNVDALGECQGAVQRTCVADSLVETDCSQVLGAGFTCELVEPLGAAQCVFLGTDASIPPAPEDAGPLAINPRRTDEPGNCVKPGWGSPAAMGVGLWFLGPRRRGRGNRR